MPRLAQRDIDRVDKAYLAAQNRIAALNAANDSRQSELREQSIAYLESFTEQIEDMDFYLIESYEFDADETVALMEAAAELEAAEEALVDTDMCTRHELEADLATLIQDVMGGRYRRALHVSWSSVRRHYGSLPRDVPQVVIDDYHVGLVNRSQGALNFVAFRIEKVAEQRCLNGEDYSSARFNGILLRAIADSADDATKTYAAVHQLQAAARAARAQNELSLGGKIWTIVGWDDPWDFCKDVVLSVATGGASKVVRWAKRVRRLRRSTTRLERALGIENRLQHLEQRAIEIQRKALKLQEGLRLADIPMRLLKIFSLINDTARTKTMLDDARKTVTRDYVRSVASSIAAKSAVPGSSTDGSILSKTAVLASVRAHLDGTSLGAKISEARKHANIALLIKGELNEDETRAFLNYFWLLTSRDLIGRLVYSGAHARTVAPAAMAEQFLKDLIDSVGGAVAAIAIDIPVLSAAQKNWLVRTTMDAIAKTLAEIGKTMVSDFFKSR